MAVERGKITDVPRRDVRVGSNHDPGCGIKADWRPLSARALSWAGSVVMSSLPRSKSCCGGPTRQSSRQGSHVMPIVKELQAVGFESLRAIAAGLDERGIPAARGGKWSATQVMRLLETDRPFDASAAAA